MGLKTTRSVAATVNRLERVDARRARTQKVLTRTGVYGTGVAAAAATKAGVVISDPSTFEVVAQAVGSTAMGATSAMGFGRLVTKLNAALERRKTNEAVAAVGALLVAAAHHGRDLTRPVEPFELQKHLREIESNLKGFDICRSHLNDASVLVAVPRKGEVIFILDPENSELRYVTKTLLEIEGTGFVRRR